MLVYLRHGSAQATVHAATLRQVADQASYLTQSQYTDTRLTSPNADLILPGTWQDSHWSTNLKVTGTTGPTLISMGKAATDAGSATLLVAAITTRPGRLYKTDYTDLSVVHFDQQVHFKGKMTHIETQC